MKRIALISAIALGALFTKTANAQVGINVGFHLGDAHIGARIVSNAPVQYDADDYYYLPDVGAYYDVADQCYFYNDGYNWVSAAYLPGYRDYDWRSFRKYEVRANRLYLRDEYYRGRYNGGVGNWGRVDERTYADRNLRRDDNRYDNRGFDDRGTRNQGQAERFNTPQEFHQFNNGGRDRAQGERFNTPRQFEQPQQNNGGRENFDHQQNDGRGMRGNGFTQPSQPNMNQHGNNPPTQNAPENHGQWGQRGGGQEHITNTGNGGMVSRFGRS